MSGPEAVSAEDADATKPCEVCGGDMPANSSSHYDAEDDARHLTHAGEVRADPKRHKMALAHLRHEAEAKNKTVAMESKVKKGLSEAFPSDGKDGE